ncbi:GDSL-type esterase/lipase family protein [Dictyobacter kobayashii]|uniref:SGNH hydrolase-type esterase domain-containing protein n=1 Tax=Dictyobacter kobayashii TaxID=2014872 RepID=A0A402AFS8_9CHLR|nr:GDSL-type esterase/lipase family protein [Dictyobacter kobayashii]GCE17967.1 hypothetical protein KDK_17670 [Dictyobacter kobayashii]
MQTYFHKKPIGILFILACALLLLFSACGSSTSPSAVKPRPHTTAPTTSSTSAKLPSGPLIYVALGASDAVGVGSQQPGAQGYVPLIATHLPQGSHMINLGVSGIRLHDALTKELPLALNTNPQLITIWLVTNDFIAGVSYGNYMKDLSSMLQQLHSQTQARMVMANLPDLTRLPIFTRSNADQKARMHSEIQRWNIHIASLAQQYGVTLVDLTAENSLLTSHPEYISSDGFHPSAAGYVQLSNLFWQAIKA